MCTASGCSCMFVLLVSLFSHLLILFRIQVEIATGLQPLKGKTESAIRAFVKNDDISFAEPEAKSLPADYAALMNACRAKDAKKRPKMDAVVTQLRKMLGVCMCFVFVFDVAEAAKTAPIEQAPAVSPAPPKELSHVFSACACLCSCSRAGVRDLFKALTSPVYDLN